MADEREKASPGADDEPEKTVPFFVTDDDQTSRLWHSPGNTATFAISGDRPPALVGRRRELSWLRTRLEQCTHGFAHMVLIEGEPGIGKTRLARELLDDARRAGIRAITGRCYEQLDLAYLPLRESLFPTLLDEFAQRSGYERELALLRRIEGESDAVDLSGDYDERERSRQLLLLTRLVLELATDTATVVLVEDLHWADPSTMDLFRHLLFRLEERGGKLLILATSRVDKDARAASGIAALHRERRCATLALGPLSEFEAAELAHELGTGTASEARQLAVMSGGNPLLVQTLARQRSGRRGASVTTNFGSGEHPMSAAIEARLDALSENTRAVVLTAAFLVPRCTRSLLAAVTGLDDHTLDDAVYDAAARGILSGDHESLVFAHPLYAHAAYEATPQPARPRIHGRIASVLLARRDAGESVPVRAIAHHLVAAGSEAESRLVVDYARRAGDESMALAAWGEAARNYEGALASMDSAADPVAAAGLHRLAGLCHRYDLDLERAVEHFDAAIELCTPLGDPETLTDLNIWRIRCGAASRHLVDVVAAPEPLEQLVEQLEESSPALAAEGLVELAQLYWVGGRPGRSEKAARRAMEIAARVDDHRAFSRAAHVISTPQWLRYDLSGSLTNLEESLVHAHAVPDESALIGPLCRLPLV
ncbi:MAG: hypothetical protein E6G60_20110, partial [Actinobacteria bacterium]